MLKCIFNRLCKLCFFKIFSFLFLRSIWRKLNLYEEDSLCYIIYFSPQNKFLGTIDCFYGIGENKDFSLYCFFWLFVFVVVLTFLLSLILIPNYVIFKKHLMSVYKAL